MAFNHESIKIEADITVNNFIDFHKQIKDNNNNNNDNNINNFTNLKNK